MTRSGGANGPITAVDFSYVNFGQIDVAGLDYRIDYKSRSRFGEWSPSIVATETYHYSVAQQPGLEATDRVSKANDDGSFSPRWKGALSIGWKQGSYAANIAGRYIGSYQDYDSAVTLGSTWYVDASARYMLTPPQGHAWAWAKNAYLDVGVVNLLNRLPSYSNFDFGYVGYDPAEGDIRGRLIYAQLGAHW